MVKFRTLLPLALLGVALVAALSGCGGSTYISRFVIVRANWTDTGTFAGLGVTGDDGRTCNSDFCSFGSFVADSSGATDQEQVSFQARSSADPYRFLLKNDSSSDKTFRVRAWLDSTTFGPSIDGDVTLPGASTYEVLVYRDGQYTTVFRPRSRDGKPLSTPAATGAGLGWKTK